MTEKVIVSATTNATPRSCIDVPCSPKKTIVYRIKTSRILDIPYAVAINGKVLELFKDHAEALKTDGKSEIKLSLKTGDKAALFLNSDASPDFRKSPVYEATVGEHDILVDITEKPGRHADTDQLGEPEIRIQKNHKTGQESKRACYVAPLTGDIWLKISHKYTVEEAKRYIPASTKKEIVEAVLHFYDGSLSANKSHLTVNLPANTSQAAMSITLKTDGGSDNNCKSNITNFDLFRDGLPRVHPAGFVALIEAAHDAGIGSVTLSSTWRPMIGSIAHRAGLGLDVNWLDAIQLNRQELRGAKPTAAADPNVSEEEKRLFKEKETAKNAMTAAEEKLKSLRKEKAALDKLKKTAPSKVDPVREAALPEEIEAADQSLKTTIEKNRDAVRKWNIERDKNESLKIKNYRASLARCTCVSQLYDPWYMDDNTHDSAVAIPNEQRPNPKGKGPSNEELHAHHLHITVHEPRIRKGKG